MAQVIDRIMPNEGWILSLVRLARAVPAEPGVRLRRRAGSFGIKFLLMDDVGGLPQAAPRAAP